jgi:hypothetical protein
MSPHVALRPLEIACLSDHLEAILRFEHHPQAVANDRVVVGKHDADGLDRSLRFLCVHRDDHKPSREP